MYLGSQGVFCNDLLKYERQKYTDILVYNSRTIPKKRIASQSIQMQKNVFPVS